MGPRGGTTHYIRANSSYHRPSNNGVFHRVRLRPPSLLTGTFPVHTMPAPRLHVGRGRPLPYGCSEDLGVGSKPAWSDFSWGEAQWTRSHSSTLAGTGDGLLGRAIPLMRFLLSGKSCSQRPKGPETTIGLSYHLRELRCPEGPRRWSQLLAVAGAQRVLQADLELGQSDLAQRRGAFGTMSYQGPWKKTACCCTALVCQWLSGPDMALADIVSPSPSHGLV